MNDSTAKARWAALDRWLNSPVGFRVLMSIFIATAIVFSVVPLGDYFRGRSIMDYRLWYDTGRDVLAGHEIFVLRSGKYDFMYPLPCALFLAGASLLGQAGLILLLVTINSAAWFFSARLAATLAAGERPVTNAWLDLGPSFLVLVYIWSNYHLGQPSLVLLALMLGAFTGLRAKREIFAGALIALAAAIKAFPAIAIVYLIYRHHWKAAASVVVTLVFLLLVLPMPFGGFKPAWRDLEKWSAGMLKYNARGVAQRPQRSYTWKNQSLVGVGNRLLRPVDINATTPPARPTYANFAQLRFATVNAIIVGVALALGISFIAVMPSRAMRTAETDAIEFALLILLMLMFTPLSFGYLFSWLMLPFAVLIQRVLAGKGSSLLWWAVPGVAILALALPFPRGAQTYGNTFFAALLLFIGLSIELLRCKRRGTRGCSPVDLLITRSATRSFSILQFSEYGGSAEETPENREQPPAKKS